MNNNIELKELTGDSFIKFIKSDLNQINFIDRRYNRNYILMFIKAKYKNNIFIYHTCRYSEELRLWEDFEYTGCYSMSTNTFFGRNYYIDKELIKNACNLGDSNALINEMKSSLSDKIYNILNNFNDGDLREKAKKQLDENDKINYRCYGCAEDYYYNDSKPELRHFYRIDFNFDNPLNILDYLDGKSKFIEHIAKEYINNHLANLYEDFLAFQRIKNEYEKIINDRNSKHHLKKAIADSITDQKNVNVTILKNNVEFKFKNATENLKRGKHWNSYPSYDIAAKDRELFYKTFGRYEDYTADEIVKITYCKKIIYKKGEK